MAFSRQVAFDFLRRANEQGRLAHAYLIAGAQGSGKRQLAVDLAALVIGAADENSRIQHPDIHIAEPESKSRRISIDQTRALEKELQMRSSRGGKKVAIIRDAERMTTSAANSFLKTLEEPPNQSLLLLTTALPESLPDTIISRCIPVTLLSPGKMEITAPQQALLDALRAFFKKGAGGIAPVMRLVRVFTDLLRAEKQKIQDENEAHLKKEEATYKQTTDSSDWLDEREDYFKALTEARYIQERTRIFETLVQWWADVLRQQENYTQLDHPDFADDTSGLARKLSPAAVLKKIAALEDLRENFGRNVQEQLAIEVAFLRAFS